MRVRKRAARSIVGEVMPRPSRGFATRRPPRCPERQHEPAEDVRQEQRLEPGRLDLGAKRCCRVATPVPEHLVARAPQPGMCRNVHDHETVRRDRPPRLRQRNSRIVQMLDDVEKAHDGRARVGQWEPRNVGLDDVERVTALRFRDETVAAVDDQRVLGRPAQQDGDPARARAEIDEPSRGRAPSAQRPRHERGLAAEPPVRAVRGGEHRGVVVVEDPARGRARRLEIDRRPRGNAPSDRRRRRAARRAPS